MIEFRIATGSSAPIYRQIADQIRRGVATGALRPAEQLPSVRALAEQLVVNPNTVARAYADLTREGVLDSQAGRGLFVAPRRVVFSAQERARRLEAALETFLHEVLLLGYSRKELQEQLKIKLKEIESGQAEAAQSEAAQSGTAQVEVPKAEAEQGATAKIEYSKSANAKDAAPKSDVAPKSDASTTRKGAGK